MVLGQYNIEFFGVGIHLFAFVIALVLFLWNITFENSSGRSRTVNLLLIFSMIRTLNKAALLIILPTYPAFFMSMPATIMVFIDNLSILLLQLFAVSFVAEKTSADGTGKGIAMNIAYIFTGIVSLIYVANIFVSVGDAPLYNKLASDGTYVNGLTSFTKPILFLAFFLMLVFFLVRGNRRLLKKERAVLIVFAILPIINQFSYTFYWGNEINTDLMAYAVLGIIAVFYDRIRMDEEFQKQGDTIDKLAYESEHDSLTGLLLPNVFKNNVNTVLEAETSRDCCIAIIDIDGFKEINAVYGRQFGDTLLAEVGNQLTRNARYDDIIGRLAGDEFGIFFKCEVRYFDNLVQKIRDALDFELDGVQVTCSIGAARVSDEDSDYDYIYDLADKALTGAKREGDASYHLISR